MQPTATRVADNHRLTPVRCPGSSRQFTTSRTDARDHQQIEDKQDEILPHPERIEVSGVGGQEGP